jgi:hypothetical protein
MATCALASNATPESTNYRDFLFCRHTS